MISQRGFNGLLFFSLAAAVCLAGCTDSDQPAENPIPGPTATENHVDQNTSTPTHVEKQKTKSAPKLKPLLAGWEKPAVAIVFSGEQHGYLEPCGCTETQSGGISRRADLFRQIEDKGWPVTAFDLGGSLKRTRRQSLLKFETLMTALADMKYAGMAVGPEELRMGTDVFLSLFNPNPENPNITPSFLAANITFYETEELGRLKWKTITVGKIKIAVTAIFGESYRKEVEGSGGQATFKIEKPIEALPAVLEKIKAEKPDLTILLAHAEKDESRALIKQFPEFDLVLTAGGPEDPIGQIELVEKTVMVEVGHKGKYAGVIGFYPENKEQKLKFELVDLDKYRFKDTDKMVEHMRFYQDRLKEEALAAESPIDHPSGANFVGAETCGQCHTKAYAKWKKTRHAHATDSLLNAKFGLTETIISRMFDPECLACHVTGWDAKQALRYNSGFLNAEFAKTAEEKSLSNLLQGQQCENCHGPGSKHIQLVNEGNLAAAKKLTHIDLATAKQNVCYKCHDLDNSPKFNFETYWEKIKHPGLD